MKFSIDKPVQPKGGEAMLEKRPAPVEKREADLEALKELQQWVDRAFSNSPADEREEVATQFFSIRDGAVSVRPGFSFEGFEEPLPEKLTVNGDFDIRYTTFDALPDDLHVTGDVLAQGAMPEVIAQLQQKKDQGDIEGLILFNH
jgi:hypothetical protein